MTLKSISQHARERMERREREIAVAREEFFYGEVLNAREYLDRNKQNIPSLPTARIPHEGKVK